MKMPLPILAAGFVLAMSAANGQAPAPVASGPVIVMDGAGLAGAATGDKKCIAANHKLDREQSALDHAHAEVARYDKLQRGCSTKSSCARYKSALHSLQKRVARHERRIGKFTDTRNKVCKT